MQISSQVKRFPEGCEVLSFMVCPFYLATFLQSSVLGVQLAKQALYTHFTRVGLGRHSTLGQWISTEMYGVAPKLVPNFALSLFHRKVKFPARIVFFRNIEKMFYS